MTSEEEKLINDIGNIVKSNPIDLHHTHEIRTSLIRLQNMHESLAKLLHESKIHPDVRELDAGVKARLEDELTSPDQDHHSESE